MRTYFAHSKKIYNTKEEKRIKRILANKGISIVCPNTDIGELGGIKGYLECIDGCSDVIVHEFMGFVGRGCFEEVAHALHINKPVFAIRGKGLVKIIGVEIYNSSDWSVRYGKLIPHCK